MTAPLPSARDLALPLVQEVCAALGSLPAERRFEVTRIAVAYLVVYAAHVLAWPPAQMAEHLREVLELAEKSTGVRAAPTGAAS